MPSFSTKVNSVKVSLGVTVSASAGSTPSSGVKYIRPRCSADRMEIDCESSAALGSVVRRVEVAQIHAQNLIRRLGGSVGGASVGVGARVGVAGGGVEPGSVGAAVGAGVGTAVGAVVGVAPLQATTNIISETGNARLRRVRRLISVFPPLVQIRATVRRPLIAMTCPGPRHVSRVREASPTRAWALGL